jgi:16S rRNA (uracil1498-N3)-methyltransferase
MRIFVDKLVPGEVTVSGDEHHYVMRVRRARVGDELELIDGEGRFARGVIAAIGATETRIAIDKPDLVADAVPRVRMLVPLIKGDRMDS